VLFGSYARGEAGPGSDIDLLLVFEKRAEARRCEDVLWDLVAELGVWGLSPLIRALDEIRADLLYRAVFSEGLVLYAKPPCTPLPAKSMGLIPAVLLWLEMPRDRRARWRAEKTLYGDSRRRGLLTKFGGEKLAPGLILVPYGSVTAVEEVLRSLGVGVAKRMIVWVERGSTT